MANIQTADVIVVGGGVSGLSTAMQLARRGVRVIVLERDRLGNGSTGRAAGLLGQLRGTVEATRMLIDGVEIVKELESEANVEIYVQTGSLRVAETPERAQEITDLVEMGKRIDFDIDHIPIDDVAAKLPYMRTDDLLNACFCPTDGHLQPAELVSAYVTLGKRYGVKYRTGCATKKILVESGHAKGVLTAEGEFHAPCVINAAGPWSYLIAELVDATLPTAALQHRFLTTTPNEAHPVDRLSPAVRDRHLRVYSRPENGGLIVGMYGTDTVEYDMETIPDDFDMSTMKPENDDHYVSKLVFAAQQRFPWIKPDTPMTVTVGIMTFTPDGKPFCGKLPGLEGLYHGAGFCGHGIVQSPVIGVIMADLVLQGRTNYDIAAIHADRFFDLPGFQHRHEIKTKCHDMYSNYYGHIEGKGA